MDYKSLFDDLHIPADYSRLKSGWVNVTCPYCGGSSFHLGINIYKDFAVCFKCGWHSVNEALCKIFNVPQNLLSEILLPYQKSHRVQIIINKKEINKKEITLPENPLSNREYNYLLSRHFNPDFLISKYNIQGGGWIGEYKNRIIIPVYFNHKLISWTSRTIVPDKMPRYKTLANKDSVINIKNVFFNLDNCFYDYVFVLEGVFDVMRFGDNSVCGFGMSLTWQQIFLLSERFKKICFLFDNETDAQKKAWKYALILQGMGIDAFTADIFSEYGYKDVGEIPPYKMNLLKKNIENIMKN